VFWVYRTYFDGEARDLHVACMKEMARLGWEVTYRSQVGGGGGQLVQYRADIMDRVLQNLSPSKRRCSGYDEFCKTARTAASDIIKMFSVGMKTDRIRTDIIDIIFVFIFVFEYGVGYG